MGNDIATLGQAGAFGLEVLLLKPGVISKCSYWSHSLQLVISQSQSRYIYIPFNSATRGKRTASLCIETSQHRGPARTCRVLISSLFSTSIRCSEDIPFRSNCHQGKTRSTYCIPKTLWGQSQADSSCYFSVLITELLLPVLRLLSFSFLTSQPYPLKSGQPIIMAVISQ